MPRVFRVSEITKPRGPISRSTFYAHAKAGRVRLRKLGGVTVVSEADWARYLEGEPSIYDAARGA